MPSVPRPRPPETRPELSLLQHQGMRAVTQKTAQQDRSPPPTPTLLAGAAMPVGPQASSPEPGRSLGGQAPGSRGREQGAPCGAQAAVQPHSARGRPGAGPPPRGHPGTVSSRATLAHPDTVTATGELAWWPAPWSPHLPLLSTPAHSMPASGLPLDKTAPRPQPALPTVRRGAHTRRASGASAGRAQLQSWTECQQLPPRSVLETLTDANTQEA